MISMKAVLVLGMVACVLVAGCVSSAEGPAVPVEGREWTLMALNGKAVSAGPNLRAPTMKLDGATKRVSGQSGVNRYSGAYELEGEKLKFGDTMGTRMAGSPEAMEMEKDFLAGMGKVSGWRVVKGELELRDGAKTVVMKFRGN
jgi:copper homeostasis protein (lipoprotein)